MALTRSPLPDYTAADRMDRRAQAREAKHDQAEIMSPATSIDDKLTLLIKHTSGKLAVNLEVRDKLAEALRSQGAGTDFFSMIANWRRNPELTEFARAAQAAFVFDDRYQPRWALIYAVVSVVADERVFAEVATSERSQVDLLAFLRASRTRHYASRVGRFIGHMTAQGHVCFWLPLETHWGDLEELGHIRRSWTLCGYDSGVRFLDPHVPNYKPAFFAQETFVRAWPSPADMAHFTRPFRL